MIIAIDPGEAHCGVAVSDDDETCADAFTLDPIEFELWFQRECEKPMRHRPNLVIFEGFRLFPWMRKEQSWSSFGTCEVIGVIKYLTRIHRIPSKEQLPPIKKPTFKIAPRLGWVFQTGGTQHSLDAEAHLAYHLLRLEQDHNVQGGHTK